MSQVSSIDDSEILRTVPFEQGFHFTTEGVYSGITAVSLSDLSSKLENVDLDSLFYHYERGDFQSWIKNTLGDEELADRIELANRTIFSQPTISLYELKTALKEMIHKRIVELQAP